MIKAVIFDLDGTLLDRNRSIKDFIEKQYDRFSPKLKSISKEEFVSRFLELDNRGYVWKDRVYEQLVDEYQITGVTWDCLLQDYRNYFKESCLPFPHVRETLMSLRENDLLLGIVTNGYGPFQMDVIKALEIERFFGTILVSEWEELKKPDPRIFLRAAQQLGVSPHECVFVGDHPVNDVRAAEQAGMKGIWKRDSYWQDVGADCVIEDLSELPPIVEKLKFA